MNQISTSDSLKNGKDLFKLDLLIIDLDLSNYNYKRSEKASKIKKRPKKFLKARTKAEYEKYQIFIIFSAFLTLIGSKHSCVPNFSFLRP